MGERLLTTLLAPDVFYQLLKRDEIAPEKTVLVMITDYEEEGKS